MSYPIPIVSRAQVEGSNPKAGLKLFPFASGRWATYTAEVVSLEIQQGKQTDYLVIKGRNGEHGVRISVSLNPAFVQPHYGHDRDEQIAKNAERLAKVLRAFDLAVFDDSGAWLEPERFASALGKVFMFSIFGAMQDGMPKYSDMGKQLTYVAFKGIANALLPVAAPDGATGDKRVNTCALNSHNAAPPFDEDVA
jgi:hypothetical protein